MAYFPPPTSQSWSNWFLGLFQSGAQQVTGALINGATAAASNNLQQHQPTIQSQLSIAQTHLSNMMQGGIVPPDLLALQRAIVEFIATPTTTNRYVIDTLITQKGWTDEAAIRAQLPHLQAADVTKISQLQARLQSLPGAVVNSSHLAQAGRVDISSLLTFLAEVRDIPLRYRINPNEGPHHAALRRLRQELNSTLHPDVKNALASLDALISLNDSSAHDVRRTHIQRLIDHLRQLNQNRGAAPQITPVDYAKFDPLIVFLNSLLPPDSAVWDLNRIKETLREVGGIIVATAMAQRGLIEESCDVLTHKIREFFGIHTGSPSEMDYSSILARGEHILNKVLGHTNDAVAKKTAQSLSVLLIFVFTHIQNQIQQNGNQQFISSRITPCLDSLKAANHSGSWQELISALQQCLRVMREQETYFQGFRLPLNPARSNTSAVPELLRLAQSHEQALSPMRKLPEQITPVMIEQMASRVKGRSTAFVTMKVVGELMCGLPAQDPAAVATDPSMTPESHAHLFRVRFFQQIDNSNLSLMWKWSAKRLYGIVHACSSLYIHAVIDNIKGEFTHWQQKGTDVKSGQVVQWLRNWFSVASGIYSEVAHTPPEKMKDIFTLLEEAAQSPARNGGLANAQLYNASVMTALDTFGPRMRWTENIAKYFDAELIPSTSNISFFNHVLRPFNFVCKKLLQGVVFIPQHTLNFFLQRGASFLFVRSFSLHSFIDESIGKVSTPTPSSYAVHQLIYNQLRKISALVHQRMIDTTQPKPLLNSKKVEIAGLWDALYELLHKSRYRTVDSLRNYVNGNLTLKERIEREIDGAFIPEAMEAIAMIISTSLEGALGTTDMLELFYNSLCVVDQTFDPQQPVSEAQFKAVETGISDLVDQNIEATIFYALNDKLDFTNDKQKKEISLFITSLKNQTKALKDNLERHQQSLARAQAYNIPVASQEILDMVTASLQFQTSHLEALGKADGNRYFHAETRNQLNEISKGLHTQLQPLSAILNAMKLLQDEIDVQFTTWQQLSYSKNLLQSIGSGIHLPILHPADIPYYKAQCETLTRHLSTAHAGSTTVLLPLNRQFNAAFTQFEQAKNTEFLLQKIQERFDIFAALKRQHPGPNSDQVNSEEQHIYGLIARLPSLEQQTALKQSLLASSERSFSHTMAQAISQTLNTCTEARANMDTLNANMELHLVGEIALAAQRTSSTRKTLIDRNQELEGKITALGTWESQVHDIPIWNIFLFDMQWITQTVSAIAKTRAKDLVNEIGNALYQRHNYKSLINQAALRFLQLYGPHNLR